jgi:hypothetical protein
VSRHDSRTHSLLCASERFPSSSADARKIDETAVVRADAELAPVFG